MRASAVACRLCLHARTAYLNTKPGLKCRNEYHCLSSNAPEEKSWIVCCCSIGGGIILPWNSFLHLISLWCCWSTVNFDEVEALESEEDVESRTGPETAEVRTPWPLTFGGRWEPVVRRPGWGTEARKDLFSTMPCALCLLLKLTNVWPAKRNAKMFGTDGAALRESFLRFQDEISWLALVCLFQLHIGWLREHFGRENPL